MAIPVEIKIKNKELPDNPGVYFYFDEKDALLYIGKATSLKKRVSSYFNKAHNARIDELVSKIKKIEYIETPTVLEALVLEANQIQANQPPYNVLLKDGKSFLYLCITNEKFPKLKLERGKDLEKLNINPFGSELSAEAKVKYLAVFGPYTSGDSLRKALEYLRKIIPWSNCEPPEVTGKMRPCFNRHIKLCPGVCTGEISSSEYRKNIRYLIQFFRGEKVNLVKKLKKEMEHYAGLREYEKAARIRNQIFSLEHIKDVAIIIKEDFELPIIKSKTHSFLDLEGRIEAYDISNISGTSSVGVMTVAIGGKLAKSEYRKFKIKSVVGPDDYASLQEVLRRRLIRAQKFPHAWPLPEIMVIDGGKGQVSAVQEVLDELQIDQPIIGIAKGFDRKQDRLIFNRADERVLQIAQRGKELFQLVRDEAHRFSVKYHRELRSKNSGIKKKKYVKK
jgi:excinuclease ABC subunit C